MAKLSKPTRLLLLLVFAFSFKSSAQQTSSFNISVTARVIESIELVTIRNMKFGRVQPGQKQIDISATRDVNAGKMVARGIPDARIKVSFIKEWDLTNVGSGMNLIFYYELAGNTVDDQSTSELLLTDNRELHLNDKGEYYFWIGGRASIEMAEPGNYEGEFTIEIEYM